MFKRFTKNPFEKNGHTNEPDKQVINQPQQHAYIPNTPKHFAQQRDHYIPPRVLVPNDPPTYNTNMPEYVHEHEKTSPNPLDIDHWDEEFSTRSNPLNGFAIEEPETIIGEELSFKGELSFKRFICIHGHFEGTLISKGKLVVGPKGKVKSDINLHETIIEGQVDGNIVADRVELRGEAQVNGNINTKSLSVDEGVSIIGQVKVMPNESSSNDSQ